MPLDRRLVTICSMLLIAACTAAPVQPTPTVTPQPTPSAAPSPSAAPPTPTSAPTASPTPSATSTPPPSASPSASPSSSPAASATPGALQLDEAEIARHLDALDEIAAQNDGRRAAGTSGYDSSVEYVAGELVALGWTVERDAFEFTFFDEAAPVEVTVGTESWTGAEFVHAMLYSAAGDVSGSVAIVGDAEFIGTSGCEQADWSDFQRGQIAVVYSGPCPRRDQVMLAQESGAVGFIGVYAWPTNEIKRPTLFDPAGINIPAVAVGTDVTPALFAAADSAEIARIQVEVEMAPASDDNVIAELAGASTDVVMIGGHLDSALDGPGVNDNGSGSATILAMAAALAAQGTPEATIRVAFWGAEEFGTIGSRSYVDRLSGAELDQIRAYLNLDMVASLNAARFVYDNETSAAGSGDITQALLDALDEMGSPGLPIDLGGGSDHGGFEAAGVPTGGVFSGIAPLTDEEAELFDGQAGVLADPCYHLACDDRSNINTQAALALGGAILTVVEELASQR